MPLPSYLLFVLLHLAATAALLSLYMLLSAQNAPAVQHPSPTPQDAFSHVIFVIDAGHGGEDGGAQGKLDTQTVSEDDINLEIALTLAQLLTDAGAQTELTRQTDTLLYDRNCDYAGRKKALDMAARLAVVERAAASGKQTIFVSIHQNTFGDARYRGLQVYYSTNDNRSAHLAQTIQETAREQLAPENERRIKQGSNIFLLKRLTCPAVLVECGFLSNPEECAALASETYRNRVAFAIFDALRKYVGESDQKIQASP